MVEYILFDLCEVYIQGVVGVQHKIGAELGLAPTDVVPGHLGGNHFHELLRGQRTEDSYWREIMDTRDYPQTTGDGEPTLDFLKRVVRENFRDLNNGVGDLLEQLSQGTVPIGLLSDHGEEWVEYVETKFPLEALFGSRRSYSFEMGRTKKDPRSFSETLRRFEFEPTRTLFVDDRGPNLVSAQAAGVGYVHLFRSSELLSEALRGHKVVF